MGRVVGCIYAPWAIFAVNVVCHECTLWCVYVPYRSTLLGRDLEPFYPSINSRFGASRRQTWYKKCCPGRGLGDDTGLNESWKY